MDKTVEVKINGRDYSIKKMKAYDAVRGQMLLLKAVPLQSMMTLTEISDNGSTVFDAFSKMIQTSDIECYMKLIDFLLNNNIHVLRDEKPFSVHDVKSLMELYTALFHVLKINYYDFFLEIKQLLIGKKATSIFQN